MSVGQPGWAVEVFYDGDCPLCSKEIAFLRRRDRRERIRFTDIAEPSFDPPQGLTLDRLMAEIHGRLRDGEIIRGVEVFRRLYSAIGWTWLVAPTRLPGVSQALDLAYKMFAARRLKLTGRCDAGCQAPATAREPAATPHPAESPAKASF